MKQLVLIALALCAAWPAAASADCRPPKPPRVTVAMVEAPLQEDRSLPIAALSKLRSGPSLPGLDGYDYALGATETVLKARAEASIEGVMQGS